MGLSIHGNLIIAGSSEDLPTRLLNAESAVMDGKTSDGRTLLEDLDKQFPRNPKILNLLGSIARTDGKSMEALKYFLQALKADPEDRISMLNLGDVLESTGKLAEANDLYFHFLDGKPIDNEVVKALVRVDETFYDQMLSKCITSDHTFRNRDFAISIIVSTYASAEFIREALEDLTSQTIADRLEIIVVDAASPQDERGVVREFQNRYDNIRYLRTPIRIGIYPAWNLAIRAATGKYIMPFSTNDRLAPDACRNLLAAIEARPTVALVYGDSHLTDLPHQKFGQHVPSAEYNGVFRWPEYSYEYLLYSCGIGPHPLWRRNVHRDVGYFDGRYKAIGDQDFWLRLGRLYPFYHLPVYTGLAWLTKDSLSGQGSSMEEIIDIHTKYTAAYKQSKIFSENGNVKCSPLQTVEQSWTPVPEPIPPVILPEYYVVTAIVSTYNSEFYFRGCLQNLVEQTLFQVGKMEIIVVDSGSTQNEAGIVREFQALHSNIVYIRTERESLYAAWNRMVLAARGRFLVNANTDDRQRKDAFEIMAGELDLRPEGLVYADAILTSIPNETYTTTASQKAWVLPDFNLRQALVDCPYGCLVMWRRSLHAVAGLFDEAYRIAGDYEFFLKASIVSGAHHIRQPLCLYFESRKNLSYQDPAECNREVNKFLPEYRMKLPLKSIYPHLVEIVSPKIAGLAEMDLGNLFINPNGRVGYPEAIHHYRQAEKLLGPMPEISNNIAFALGKMGMQSEADKLLRNTIAEFPGLAQHLGTNNQFLEAIIYFVLPDSFLDRMPKVIFGAQQRVSLSEYEVGSTQVAMNAE